jgi:hypothetical protein
LKFGHTLERLRTGRRSRCFAGVVQLGRFARHVGFAFVSFLFIIIVLVLVLMNILMNIQS